MASIVTRKNGKVYLQKKVQNKWKQVFVGSGDEGLAKAKKLLLIENGEDTKTPPPRMHISGSIKGNKIKSDTTAGQVALMLAAASGVIQPPDHVTISEQEWPFWESIILSRARSTWNQSDLEQAALLAKTKCDIERLITEVRVEGDMIDAGIKGMIVNPKHDLIEKLSRRSLALARAIHVDATATQGRSRDTGEKTKREHEQLAKLNDDDLLARPTIQ